MRHHTLISIASVAAFGLFFYGTDSPNSTTSGGGGGEEAQLPWIATVRQNCQAYRAAPNDIQKSSIFRNNEALIRGSRADNVRGTLRELSTDQGGSSLALAVSVGSDVKFSTERVFAGISQGSAVYQQAASLRAGQCVIFSGTVQSASSMVEESKVCDPEYFFGFTSIQPCP